MGYTARRQVLSSLSLSIKACFQIEKRKGKHKISHKVGEPQSYRFTNRPAYTRWPIATFNAKNTRQESLQIKHLLGGSQPTKQSPMTSRFRHKAPSCQSVRSLTRHLRLPKQPDKESRTTARRTPFGMESPIPVAKNLQNRTELNENSRPPPDFFAQSIEYSYCCVSHPILRLFSRLFYFFNKLFGLILKYYKN